MLSNLEKVEQQLVKKQEINSIPARAVAQSAAQSAAQSLGLHPQYSLNQAVCRSEFSLHCPSGYSASVKFHKIFCSALLRLRHTGTH